MMKNLWESLIPMKIPGEPERITDQQKGECIKWRASRGRMVPYIHHFTKPTVLAYHRRLGYHLLRYRPEKPIEGPVAIYITWCFPTNKKKDWNMPKKTKPDVDNMAKGILDILTELRFFLDDNQVCELGLKKYWSSKKDAGTFINIYYDLADRDPLPEYEVKPIGDLMGEEPFKQIGEVDKTIEAVKEELLEEKKKKAEVVDFRSEGLPWE